MITGGWTNCVKLAFLNGVHQPTDVYKLALYDGAAHLNALTERYATEHEISAKGYTAGGRTLEGRRAELQMGTGMLSWENDVIWPQATIRSPGGLIYNASKDNAALCVLEFGEEVRSTNGRFKVPMPRFSTSESIFRLA
jgi:hypothetical protein